MLAFLPYHGNVKEGRGEGSADPVQQGEAIVFLFRLLFLFYNPNTVNLHVLMVLSIRGIVNAMFLPELFKSI